MGVDRAGQGRAPGEAGRYRMDVQGKMSYLAYYEKYLLPSVGLFVWRPGC